MRLAFLLSVITTLTLCANPSFRYGHITWRKVSTTSNEIEFNILLGLDNAATPAYVSGNSYTHPYKFKFGDGNEVTLSGTIQRVITSDKLFFINPIIKHVYPNGIGPWTAFMEGEARWNLLVNNDLVPYRLITIVSLQNGNAHSPEIDVPYKILFNKNAPQYTLNSWDKDGGQITFRLSDAFELGGTLDVNDPTAAQLEQPTSLTVSAEGVVEWLSTADDRNYNLQVIITDQEGGTSVLDLVIKKPTILPSAHSPVVGGGVTPPNGEVFLINNEITFSVYVSDAEDTITSLFCTELPAVVAIGSTQTVDKTLTRSYKYTPDEVGVRRLCFWAVDAKGDQSNVFCFYQSIFAGPLVQQQWQVPSRQVVGHTVQFWFTGQYLSNTDRVRLEDTTLHTDCSHLTDASTGIAVTVDTPVTTVASSTVNYQHATATLTVSSTPGRVFLCYQLRTGVASNHRQWTYVGQDEHLDRQYFDVKATGVYKVSTLPSPWPVSTHPFVFLIDGVDLQRFDRLYFVTPDKKPPGLSTAWNGELPTTRCNGAVSSVMVKDIIGSAGLGIGFVRGNERAEFPWVWPADTDPEGKFLCYKPLNDDWQLLAVIQKSLPTGPWRIVGSSDTTINGNAAVSVTVLGDQLTTADLAQAFTQSDDCSRFGTTPTGSSPVQTVTPTGPQAVTLTSLWGQPQTVTGLVAVVSVLVVDVLTPGINFFTLCYKHAGTVRSLGEVAFRDKPFTGDGIPDPYTTTRTFPWVDFQPITAPVGLTTYYEFNGIAPFGYTNCQDNLCTAVWIKVAEHGSCVGNARGGEERLLDADRRVQFALLDEGAFRFCIKHRIDWEPVVRPIEIVARPDMTNADVMATPFNQLESCKAWAEHNVALKPCGCYVNLADGKEFVNVPYDFPLPPSSTNLNLNQGCCADDNAARTKKGQFNTQGATWGFCTLEPVAVHTPYYPFTRDIPRI